MKTDKAHTHHRGFTMIEMVAVLIVAAIFATFLAFRPASTDKDLSVQAELLKASLRFAQIKALSDCVGTQTWGISFSSAGTSYTLVWSKEGITTSPVNLPGEYGNVAFVFTPSPTHTLPTGMTISAGAGTTVAFDQWGRPVDGSGNPVDADITLSFHQGTLITVTKNTGLVL